MKRKVFATAVVLLTITTPLFAGQEAAAKQPATGSEKQQPAAAAKQQPAPAAAKQAPAPAAAKPQPVPASAKQAPAPAAAKQQPAAASADKKATPQTAPSASVAAAKPGEPAKQAAGASAAPVAGKSTGKPPAPPKTPSVKLNPVVTATSKPLPNKAVAASAGNAPVPTAAAKASVTSLSALQLKVQSSKTLISALQPKLAGVDVVSAADGFKDLQQFVSAVHASHNLGLRFDTLKTKLLTSKHANLRQAIQELRPAASAAIESQRAQYDADGALSVPPSTRTPRQHPRPRRRSSPRQWPNRSRRHSRSSSTRTFPLSPSVCTPATAPLALVSPLLQSPPELQSVSASGGQWRTTETLTSALFRSGSTTRVDNRPDRSKQVRTASCRPQITNAR